MRANGLLGTAKPGHIETSDHSDVMKRYIDRQIDRQTYLYSAYKFKRVTKRFGRQINEFSETV